MILAARDGSDIQTRDIFAGTDRIPRPTEVGGQWSDSGRLVSVETASALPTVMSAIRLVSETVGIMPLDVNRDGPDGPEPAKDTWQWALLHDEPNPVDGVTPYQSWTYAAACREGWGGGFFLKGKAMLRGDNRVMFLKGVEPAMITPKISKGELLFDLERMDGAMPERLSRSDVLYLPGLLFDHPLIGVSPVAVHRNMLGGATAMEEYGHRFFANGAMPGAVLIAGEATNADQRREAKESWQAQHRGTRMAHGTAVLPNGWTVERVGVSPQDAQYIDGQKWNLEQVARIFRVPAWMLGGLDQTPRLTVEQKNIEFLTFSLQARLAAIEQALHADPDLFPDKSLRPRFDADELLRVDFATRATADLRLRQAGIATVNELRPHYGLAPHPEGNELQATPVGGAPNADATGPSGQTTSPPDGSTPSAE